MTTSSTSEAAAQPAPLPVTSTARNVATLLSSAFWAVGLGLVVLFVWSIAVGGVGPGEVLPLTLGAAAVIALWVMRSRAMRSHKFEVTHDPRVMRQHDRRGFY